MRYLPEIEKYRFTHPLFGPSPKGSLYGAFKKTFYDKTLMMIASDGEGDGWEHVSASFPNCCPTWEQMCFVKSLFWGDDETVIQFHPKTSEYVNNHPYCLHLWKKKSNEYELPPSILVGIK